MTDRIPAGWYADPEMADTRRYWDGERWTDAIAPGTPQGATSGEGRLIAAWICAFVVPPAGIVLGFMLPNNRHQTGVLAVSIVMTVLTLAWLSGVM